MKAIIVNTLLIAAALALPAWLAWRKSQRRPALSGWLASLLLGLPFAMTLLLHPEWLSHPVSDSVGYLVLFPLYLGLSALAGGLLYWLVPQLLVGGKALGKAFMGFEWRQPVEDKGYGGITRKEVADPFDINTECYYSVDRRSIWDDD